MREWWVRFGEEWRLWRGITPWDYSDAPWYEPDMPTLDLVDPPLPVFTSLRYAFINSVCNTRWYLAWLGFKIRWL